MSKEHINIFTPCDNFQLQLAPPPLPNQISNPLLFFYSSQSLFNSKLGILTLQIHYMTTYNLHPMRQCVSHGWLSRIAKKVFFCFGYFWRHTAMSCSNGEETEGTRSWDPLTQHINSTQTIEPQLKGKRLGHQFSR